MIMKSQYDSPLKLIRQALAISNTSAPPPLPVAGESFFTRTQTDPIREFEEVLTALQGQFIPCDNLQDAVNSICRYTAFAEIKSISCAIPSLVEVLESGGLQITADPGVAGAAITDCECLVARTGAVVLSAAQSSGRAMPVFAPVHVVVAYRHQVLDDTDEAIQFLLDKYGNCLPSSLHFAAGPSRTGDIEKTLVTGVHGPGKVLVLLLP